MKIRRIENAPAMGSTHAIPVTVDEFALLQRHYPIVFSVGGEPVPLALMGLNEGANVFLDASGLPHDPSIYIPAYMRRYPFLLARLRPDSDELSLCFDPTSGAVGEFDEGEALFDGDQPSEATKAILQFCEQFETAGQRTAAFIQELKNSDLLMDGEVAIQPEGARAAVRLSRLPDGRRREVSRAARRRAAQDEPERHAAADLCAPVLAVADPRIFSRQVQQGKGPIAVPAAGDRRSVSARAGGPH